MNKTVLNLIERASRKGIARAYSYKDYYGNPEHVEKYRVTVKGGKWSLYHYYTLTATVAGGIGKVVYGESRSDVDSIQTFIEELAGYTPELHYYPSKELFTVVKNGKVVKQF